MDETKQRFQQLYRIADNGCWIWKRTNNRGYGAFSLGREKKKLAHRMSWELNRGPIPFGMCVLHNCPGGDDPRCVNPEHLFLGTQADNVADMVAKRRGVNLRGEKHAMAKLTASDVDFIRFLGESGLYRQRALARVFGVTPTTVCAILAKRNWASS